MSATHQVVAGAGTLAAVAVAVGALVTLHVLPTGLSPVRDAVSHYGITRYRLGYRVLTISMGVAGLAAAAGLAVVVHGGAALVDLFLVAFALARLAISWYPMDEPGLAPTEHGRRHGLLALLTFTSVMVAGLRLPRALQLEGVWASQLAPLRVFGWLLLVAAVGMIVTRRLGGGGLFGLAERAFYLATFCWLGLVGMALV
ncbi:MAG TPA: DUF998 domain-containing protein [Actinomycetes bacterium]